MVAENDLAYEECIIKSTKQVHTREVETQENPIDNAFWDQWKRSATIIKRRTVDDTRDHR